MMAIGFMKHKAQFFVYGKAMKLRKPCRGRKDSIILLSENCEPLRVLLGLLMMFGWTDGMR